MMTGTVAWHEADKLVCIARVDLCGLGHPEVLRVLELIQ